MAAQQRRARFGSGGHSTTQAPPPAAWSAVRAALALGALADVCLGQPCPSPAPGCPQAGIWGYVPICATINFSSVPSVVDGSCRACGAPGDRPATCNDATCEAGYSHYQSEYYKVGNFRNSRHGDSPLVDYNCGPGARLWHREAPWNGGCVYTDDTVNWAQGVCCADALHPSVVDGSCTVCVGDQPEDCLHATCEEGFIPNSLGRVTAGECVSCATIDLSAWPQVLNGSCTSCTSSFIDLSDCTSYSCAAGYHNQTTYGYDVYNQPSSHWSCVPSCHTIDFSSVPSVVDGSCTICPRSPPPRQPTDCIRAECEVGYKPLSFKDGRCSVDHLHYLKFVIPVVILLLVPCTVVCCVKKRRASKSSGESELETSLRVSSGV